MMPSLLFLLDFQDGIYDDVSLIASLRAGTEPRPYNDNV
jgi:hypothetical protein